MSTKWGALFLALLAVSCHALPIADNSRVAPLSSRQLKNSSSFTSIASMRSPSPPKRANEKSPAIDSGSDENASLLTSIPTFAPPGAIKKRGELRKTPITYGEWETRWTQRLAYRQSRLQNKRRRGPTPENPNLSPPAATDATQPHKEPVSESTVDFINSAGHQTIPNSANQMNNEPAANDPTRQTSANSYNNALSYMSGNSANKFNNAIQDMASPGSAKPSPESYKDKEMQATSEDVDPYSRAHTLGTISHSQFQVEDQGKRKRDDKSKYFSEEEWNRIWAEHTAWMARTNGRGGRKDRKRTPYWGLGKTEGGYNVTTVWNGKVKVDDLSWWEEIELDDHLRLWATILKHAYGTNGTHIYTTPPNITYPNITYSMKSSSATPQPIQPPARSPTDPIALSSIPLPPASSSAVPPEPSLTASPPRPKPLSKALGLVSHEMRMNRTHRGNKRLHMEDLGMEEYDPLLDISDEAYDQFRKDNPKFFGGIGGKKEKRGPANTENGQDLESRVAAAPSWLAMVLSPSAWLEKKPIAQARALTKRDSTEGTPSSDSLWVPDVVPVFPETTPSSPERRDMPSQDISSLPSMDDCLLDCQPAIIDRSAKRGDMSQRDSDEAPQSEKLFEKRVQSSRDEEHLQRTAPITDKGDVIKRDETDNINQLEGSATDAEALQQLRTWANNYNHAKALENEEKSVQNVPVVNGPAKLKRAPKDVDEMESVDKREFVEYNLARRERQMRRGRRMSKRRPDDWDDDMWAAFLAFLAEEERKDKAKGKETAAGGG